LELRQLQYFAALFEEGSVTRAARRMNVVQPALSMQMAKLETMLGQKLFERTTRGMVPTAAARTLYRLARPILRDLASAQDEMAKLAATISGRVSIGLLASVTNSVLPDSLAAFAEAYPQVEVSVAEGYTTSFIDWVGAGQLDLAVINRPPRKLGLASRHLLDEDMVLVAATGIKLPVPTPVPFGQLPKLKLVLPSTRHGLRGLLDGYAQQEDIELAPRLEVDSLVSIAELVARSDWMTVLPAIAVHRGLADGSLVAYPIVAPRVARTLVVIHQPRRPLSPAAIRLVEIMAAKLVQAAAVPARR
jgi:LysR family transcriptional regulator, nitrogen assimilation regulatory protein